METGSGVLSVAHVAPAFHPMAPVKPVCVHRRRAALKTKHPRMKTPIVTACRAACACTAGWLFSASWAHAQAVNPPPARTDSARPPSSRVQPTTTESAETIIELSPFTVEATSDTSYGALNSNSITSFKAELEKLPISADVITSRFMEDTNSTTLENMLREYSAGAGTGSAAGDVGGIPVNQPLDRGGGDSVSAGVLIRPLGQTVYLLPPYCLSQEDMDVITDALTRALDALRLRRSE